jgi:V8-like Glu-specific endopeptidase
MKTFLVFKKTGETVEEKLSSKSKTFELTDFTEFKYYKQYENYVILYNDNEHNNITVFYFTDDKFKGDVALIKIDKNNNIKDLTSIMYFKIISKTKIEQNDMYYSSEEEEKSFSF